MRLSREFARNSAWFKLSLIAVLCIAITFLRQPNSFIHPQFWAEDGINWYKDAYQYSFSSLFMSYAGTFQFFLRLVGVLATFFPISWAPSIFVYSALFIQILPILIIHSRRFKPLFPSQLFLWTVTSFYLLQPNTFEIHANLTNAGWHLALVAFLALIGPNPSSGVWKYFDITIIAISSLTGPFGIFLTPIAIINYAYSRTPFNKAKMLLILIISILQLITLSRTPSPATVNAQLVINNKSTVIQTIGSQTVGITTLGRNTIGRRTINGDVATIYFYCYSIVIAFALATQRRELKMFVIFGVIILFASLFRSQDNNLTSWWAYLVTGERGGGRYFYIPNLSWFVGLVSLIKLKHWLLRTTVFTLVLPIIIIAIPADFKFMPRSDVGFYEFASKFQKSKKGTELCTPIHPLNPPRRWELCLKKR